MSANLFCKGYIEYYQELLASALAADDTAQSLRSILGHLATGSPSGPEPVLIHCSLGKDRTGVICALILSICGVEDDIVAHEYALTALGRQRKIAQIMLEIRPHAPSMTEEEQRFFGSR